MKLLFVGMIIVMVAALQPTSALAADFNWNGCYVGFSLGGIQRSSNFTSTVSDPSTGVAHLGVESNEEMVSAAGTGSSTTRGSGAVEGAQGGCNLQPGRVVFGVEGDIQRGVTTPLLTGTGTLTTGDTFSFTNAIKSSWMVTLRPRVGVRAGRSLLYGTGGVAFAGVEFAQVYSDSLFSASGSSFVSEKKTGWTAGGGAEVALDRHWSVRAEYLFAKFPSTSVATGTITSTTQNTNLLSGSGDMHAHTIRGGVNFRF